MHYFGEKWEPAVDTLTVPVATPVGARCDTCRTPIYDGDRGYITGDITTTPYGSLDIDHRECVVMLRVGHGHGACGCNGPREPEQMRADAVELWTRLYPGH